MLKLLDDPIVLVRKSAAYEIRNTTQSDAVALRLAEIFKEKTCYGYHQRELLESYIIHSRDPRMNEFLEDLAKSTEIESVRNTAISQLEFRKSVESIKALLFLLEEPPLVTWGIHSSLIGACSRLKIEIPRVERLENIDDLNVQEELCYFLNDRIQE